MKYLHDEAALRVHLWLAVVHCTKARDMLYIKSLDNSFKKTLGEMVCSLFINLVTRTFFQVLLNWETINKCNNHINLSARVACIQSRICWPDSAAQVTRHWDLWPGLMFRWPGTEQWSRNVIWSNLTFKSCAFDVNPIFCTHFSIRQSTCFFYSFLLSLCLYFLLSV